jgi:hypothetical protein
MAKLHEVQAELSDALENYRALVDPRPSERKPIKAKIEALRADLQAILTEGSEPCSECGNQPHGIEQPYAYEVGCLSVTCTGRRAQGRSIDQAVDRWNVEHYLNK